MTVATAKSRARRKSKIDEYAATIKALYAEIPRDQLEETLTIARKFAPKKDALES